MEQSRKSRIIESVVGGVQYSFLLEIFNIKTRIYKKVSKIELILRIVEIKN